MEELIALLENIKAWHWFSLAIILVAIDSVATGGFLLGIALSSLVLWLLKAIVPSLSWQIQLALFAILSLVFTILYNKYFKSFNQESDVQNINNRAAQMIGKQITLTHEIPEGQGKIQIGDTFWKVDAKQTMLAGDKIKISGSDGMTLTIEKI